MQISSTEKNLNINIKKWCIALTGAVATGKSTVANILRNLGYDVIDADTLARQVVKPQTETFNKIIESFGPSVLRDDGELNRDVLRDLVMNSVESRRTLETIIHPAIENALKSEILDRKLGYKQIFFYEAALIFERGREKFFRATWATTCSEKTQLARLHRRSKLPIDSCKKIIESQ